MNEHPIYKSLKVTFATWQALTRIAAQTGEARTQIVDRLARQEEDRLAQKRPEWFQEGTGYTGGDTGK